MIPNGDSLWSRYAYKEDIPRHLHFFYPKHWGYMHKNTAIQFKELSAQMIYIPGQPVVEDFSRGGYYVMLGASWEEIIGVPRYSILRLFGINASVLDYCLIHPKLEELIGLCGNMIVVFEKADNSR